MQCAGQHTDGRNGRRVMLRLRRVVLDVDKAIKEPSIFALVEAIQNVSGVAAVNATLEEMDVDVMGLVLTIEGDGFDYTSVEEAINRTGAVIHSVDQIVAGEEMIEIPIIKMPTVNM
jgi:hypothetical protein